ncbi:hypothetical protein H310_07032 [Aphanomyces invadans]|uniref:EF-hand domain-containing protein n=1 Tax=Aphanomyces invadans TaxID=157072 RepID=A0A024U2F4_9STRA|nr:hypothetical protein H310_07032 [Aphanomyces invadans]ETW00394.1 hypothetical protein H310_07032 [Aphanomyces invadans]|eukprot:XP_008870529.1 hypothetical protein H310_07032 [Aphanomyces invadans]
MNDRKSGRRQRKPTGGATNLNRERWTFLSTVEELPLGGRQKSRSTSNLASGPRGPLASADKTKDKGGSNQPVAVDIDGDGMIDVREMRMAKYLHDITSKMTKPDGTAPTDAELRDMQVTVGRYTLAQDFVHRNKGKLWRYGPTFADKSDDECVRFVAEHKNFKKILPYLEFMERRRTIRSSSNLRSCLNEQSEMVDDDGNVKGHRHPQTWVYTQRKLKTPTHMNMMAVHKAVNSTYASRLEEPDDPLPVSLDALDELPTPPPRKPLLDPLAPTNKDVFRNNFGVIDIDGDGVIDDFEMQLHVQLQESRAHDAQAVDLNGDGRIDDVEEMLHEKARSTQLQAEGRHLMAKDFVKRNAGDMWLYNPVYRDKTDDEVIELLANDKGVFSKTMNKLRAKERVLGLKSSKGVTACLVDPKVLKFRPDPANILTPRQVISKSELDKAQREFSKHLNSHGMDGAGVFVKHLRLDALQQVEQSSPQHKRQGGLGRSHSTPVIGLPKLYASPIKLATVQEFRITKWKTGDAPK